ncbi:MAG: hypothetical protein K6U03_01365 [Firmicutes bacterium]|nr:hypothetical protein [Bacillota bacterium]
MGWTRRMGRRLLRAALLGLVRPRRGSLLGRAIWAMGLAAPFLAHIGEEEVRAAGTRPPGRR